MSAVIEDLGRSTTEQLGNALCLLGVEPGGLAPTTRHHTPES